LRTIPAPPIRRNYMDFHFKNGQVTSINNLESIKEVINTLESAPSLNKDKAYFIYDNKLIFLENVDYITWDFEKEEVT
jgi:hypothetical protein